MASISSEARCILDVLTRLKGEDLYTKAWSNELQSVTDGRWKRIFPHTYRSAVGMPRATGGIPSNYHPVKLEKAELFDTSADIGETADRAAAHPEIVAPLTAFADEMRSELGDSLTA